MGGRNSKVDPNFNPSCAQETNEDKLHGLYCQLSQFWTMTFFILSLQPDQKAVDVTDKTHKNSAQNIKHNV